MSLLKIRIKGRPLAMAQAIVTLAIDAASTAHCYFISDGLAEWNFLKYFIMGLNYILFT